MELMHIPLSELAIAKVNVRHGVKKADYKDLIPSHQGTRHSATASGSKERTWLRNHRRTKALPCRLFLGKGRA